MCVYVLYVIGRELTCNFQEIVLAQGGLNEPTYTLLGEGQMGSFTGETRYDFTLYPGVQVQGTRYNTHGLSINFVMGPFNIPQVVEGMLPQGEYVHLWFYLVQ